MTMKPEERRLLAEYADLFKIPAASYKEQPEEAYAILATFYGYPTVLENERKKFLDGLLREAAAAFGRNSLFLKFFVNAVGMQIHQINWHGRRESNEDLIRQFKWLLVGVTVLFAIGISPAWGTGRRGVEEAIRQNSVRAGIARARQRFLQGAGSGIVEAIVQKGATRFPVGAALVALGIIAYYGMERRMNAIREIMSERFEDNLATEEELNKISNASFMKILEESLGEYWK